MILNALYLRLYCSHITVQLAWPLVIGVKFVIKLCLVFLLTDNGLSPVAFKGCFVTMCG